MNFNKAIIAGNLTRDPEMRSLPSGQPVANFGVASNRRYTDREGNRQETTEFHNIVAFGKWADISSRYLRKGMPVLVEGRLRTNSWEGQDGIKRSRTEIIMEFMQMGPRLAGSGTGPESSPSPAPAQKNTEQQPIAQEDIPVIEAEEPMSQPAQKQESPEPEQDKPAEQNQPEQSQPEEPEAKNQVNVNNIPF